MTNFLKMTVTVLAFCCAQPFLYIGGFVIVSVDPMAVLSLLFGVVLLGGAITLIVHQVRKDEAFTTEWAIAEGVALVLCTMIIWPLFDNAFKI